MNIADLYRHIAGGEDSTHQFKADVKNGKSLAAEMAAFANTNGGTIYIGVADDGSPTGLAKRDVGRVNQLISNAASQGVRSPLTVQTENVLLENGRTVIVLNVPRGIDKPYFDTDAVIWLKTGSDKRRVNSKEELQRIFQGTHKFHADELPTRAGIDKLDKLRLRDFLRDVHHREYPDDPTELKRLLQNMNLMTDNAKLNLAGVLLFAERPQLIVPQFVVKAIHFPGNEFHQTDYIDTEDFEGPLPKIFADALAFVMRNLHKLQAGRGVNAPGTPEIPAAVFEELLVNALVHRDYTVSAPIRLFIFADRIEIISPGHLPNNLTVDKIRAGTSNTRNPILFYYASKGLLPFHGIGSGVSRALDSWPDIEFVDDRDRCLFIATIRRVPVATAQLVEDGAGEKVSGKDTENGGKRQERTPKTSGKNAENVRKGAKVSGKTPENGGKRQERTPETSGKNAENVRKDMKTSGKILKLCQERSTITVPEMAQAIGISERSVLRNIKALRARNLLHRAGGRKEGYWEVRGD